ncbi:cohesin subunit SA-2-like isoform X1 [Drosophila montana]|uniref:cohesin subunit SA-2-like isoform X1 n=1 Tax=Drosophila montana TaxID=40370 RepID=UPI00313EE5F5
MSNIEEEIETATEAAEEIEFMNIPDSSEESNSNKNLEDDFEMTSSDDELDTSLLQLVRNKEQNMEDICSEWIQLYVTKPEAALIKFMQFVLEASGSGYQIPEDSNLPLKSAKILNAANGQFENKCPRYPLITRASHALTMDVTHFVHQLMHAVISTAIILDNCFVRHISGFLVVASDSDVLPLRHTSTLIALKMMTTLSDLMTLQQDKLRTLWMQMFDEVFLKRRRDEVEDIRALCIAECGLWLHKFPQCYINPMQAQHLFEALQDSSRKVCESSLRALINLQKKPKLRLNCLQLGYKFRTTLLSLSMRPESELSEMAIQLLVRYHRAMPQLLDVHMIDIIEQLVFATKRGVAQASAELLQHRFQHAATERDRVQALVQFFIKFEGQEHAAYLVDAFYGRSKIVLDWSTMVDMLLKPETLTSQQTSVIIEILTIGVKQAVTGELPPGRSTNTLLRQPMPDATKQASEIILPALATLLRQYRIDYVDIKHLLELPPHMTCSQAQAQELIDLIKSLMFKHSNFTVLQRGATALEQLFKQCPALMPNYRKDLLEKAVVSYMKAESAWQQAVISSQHSRFKVCNKRLLVALRLISALYERFDLHEYQLTDTVLTSLKRAIRDENKAAEVSLPDEAVRLCLEIYYVAICWDLKRVQEAVSAGKYVDEDCLVLGDHLEEFFLAAFHIIECSSDVSISCEAFVSACDLLVLFADTLRRSGNNALRSLEYKSSTCELQTLENFVLRYVFNGDGSVAKASDGQMLATLQSKRRVLAGFCKLAFNNIIPVLRASAVFQHYEQFHATFGDILHATLERCMSINMINFGMALMHTCLLVYKRIRADHASPVQAADSAQFAKLINMARLFGDLLSQNLIKSRPAVLILHRAGIRYATEWSTDLAEVPANLLYLKVLRQFVPQLLAEDMLDVLNYLDASSIRDRPTSCPNGWEPLLAYRNSLESALNQSCRRELDM